MVAANLDESVCSTLVSVPECSFLWQKKNHALAVRSLSRAGIARMTEVGSRPEGKDGT